MLGFSSYFQDLDEDYIRFAASHHFKYVMTSLQIPEEDYSDLPKKLPRFLNLLKELNLVLIPDVSPQTFNCLNIEKNDFQALKSLGFSTIRLDYGFDDASTLKKLMQDFTLVLNASIIEEPLLLELQKENVDLTKLYAMHNFYPRVDSGLRRDEFLEKNKLLRKYGIKVMAFICGDELKRFPMYEGLPTLEMHRDLSPLASCIDLVENLEVDDVFIGDSKATRETILALENYMENKIVNIKALDLPSHLYNEPLTLRKENCPDIIRIATPRTKDILPIGRQTRMLGAITMDNELMGRYCGEVQILKKSLKRDPRVNVIGYIHPFYLDVLNYIKSNMKILFIK